MSKVVTIAIQNFSGGVSDFPREDNATKFQSSRHFDTFTDPQRLIPYRSLEADTNDGSSVQNTVVSPGTTTNSDDVGSVAWVNPNNSQATDNTYAVADFSTTTQTSSSPTLVNEYSVANGDLSAPMYQGSAVTSWGQSFSNAQTGTLDSCIFYMNKQGSPTGNVVAKLYNMTGTLGTDAKPTGSPLATSNTFDVSTLSGTVLPITFGFSGAERITLTPGNYIIQLTNDSLVGDSSNYVMVRMDNTSPTHEGIASYLFTGVWTNIARDVCFKIYIGELSSNYLKATNFGLAIPANSIINGIKVEIEQKSTATSTESEVRLVDAAGTVGSTNKSTGATLPAADAYTTYGSTTDTWGLNLSVSDVNDADFGVVFSTTGTGAVSVDHIKMTVYYQTSMKQYVIKDFLYASASAKLYGLGQTGAGLTKIVYKADATGILDNTWTLPATSEGNGAVKNGCFVEYKDYIFGFQGTNQIFKWGLLSGTPSITNSASTTGVTITSVAQGLVYEDYLYLPYNNKIWRATDATTFSDAYLVLPTNIKITSLTAYGKYIAIAVAPISNYNGVSKVLLWDGTSTDIQESIDWGEGELRILETIEGMLVGVTDRYLNNATGAGKGSMIVQVYQGGAPQVIKEVFTKALVGKDIPINKAVKNNRVFWAAKIMTNSSGTLYNEGIWSFGRKNVNYPFALSLDIVDETIDTDGIQAFGMAGNFFLLTHSGDGSISKTNDTAVYTTTSAYESQVMNFGDVDSDKTLLSLKVSFRKLISGEQLVAKYRVDGATAWTTIGTFTTADALSHTFLNIESTGNAFASGREYEFRLESTGGLEITGLTAKARINDNAG